MQKFRACCFCNVTKTINEQIDFYNDGMCDSECNLLFRYITEKTNQTLLIMVLKYKRTADIEAEKLQNKQNL